MNKLKISVSRFGPLMSVEVQDKPIKVHLETFPETTNNDLFTGVHAAVVVLFNLALSEGTPREVLAQWLDDMKMSVLGGYTLEEVLGEEPNQGGPT